MLQNSTFLKLHACFCRANSEWCDGTVQYEWSWQSWAPSWTWISSVGWGTWARPSVTVPQRLLDLATYRWVLKCTFFHPLCNWPIYWNPCSINWPLLSSLRPRAVSCAPPSPSSPHTPSSGFASPYQTCDHSLSVSLWRRGQCGRRRWCLSWRNWSWNTKKHRISRVNSPLQDSRGLPASPSYWRPPSPTFMVGAHTVSYWHTPSTDWSFNDKTRKTVFRA